MINYLFAIIYGVIQGITEFLPVSSSGHLVLLHKFFPLTGVNDLVFDVTLHLATFLAVFWYFRSEIWKLATSWLQSFRGQADENSRLAWYIIIATIPSVIAGYLWQDAIENYFRSVWWVAIMLIIVGLLFILAEKYTKKEMELNSLDWKKSLFIGIAQAVALIPGTSRSGITIISGLASNLKREVAVKFSFLLSMPVILGAFITKIPDISGVKLASGEFYIIIIAFVSALFSAILAIKYFLKFSRTLSLNVFAYYRIILAIIIILLLSI